MTDKKALKLALDDLMVEYDMERTSFAKRVDEIFKQALAAQQEPEPLECTYGYSDCRALAIANTAQRTWVGSGDLEDSNAYQTPPTQPTHVQELTNIQRHEQNVQKFLAAQPAPVQEQDSFFKFRECEDSQAGAATPPAAQRQWVGLTTEEIYDCDEANACRSALAYAIEAKLKEKNT